MELRVLKYFLTVAAEGNITRAADILHVTQPTLSRQLKELEDELGTALLIRGKRSVTLTDEGFLFRQQAETIVELADKLEHTFTDKKDIICGTVRIGATEAVGGRTLAVCMKEFREKYPGVQFELYNGMADNIKEMIEHGLLDLGLVMEPIDTAKFEYVRMPQKETWGILVRRDHQLAKKETVTAEDIKQYPLIMPGRENAKEQILHWMQCEERHLDIPAYYNILSNAALLVEAGMGCAVCLDGALSIHADPELCFRQIHPAHVTRSVILWKKNHLFSQAASLFVQTIQEH
ncbi:LysR family transcriptional regulator [Faecalicatena fissicatena]|uniref:LysR family transcriptional regulator n=1 Tax=Faecalicatena fissicatena TaxID=290055 RepID=A0ABS2E6H2_9FIRM|nr:LysR family transcriptional regulator [Faecalicatena fissicatena]MBM6737241.1 LysR family transcriptional regulator [Faecalicatena fissicatena]HIX98981.1 LysR family transcriptional regulator [Candidatus Dorea intestinigallinarum]